MNSNILEKYAKVLSQNPLPVGEIEYNKLDLKIEELDCIVFDIDDFLKSCSLSSSATESNVLAKLYELICGFGLVGSKDDEEKEYCSNDFPHTAQMAVKCFELCKLLLNTKQDLEECDKNQIIINSLLLCATHSDIYSWSNENSKALSIDFSNCLLSFTKHDHLSSLLCDDNFYPSIFKRILKKIRPYLMPKTWLKNPSSCYIFSWILHQVGHPFLADYLHDVFPPPCMFISDHQVCHRVLAIQCYQHILDNVPPTLIRLDNRGEVMYTFLKPYMHSTEEDIIAVLAPCLLKLLSFKADKMTEVCWSRYDEFLNMLLVRAEMEFKPNIKMLYLSHIHTFIQLVPPFKHLKRLWKVVEESLLRDSDVCIIFTVLQILKHIIKSCWPRMNSYCFKILKSLAIFLDNFEEKKVDVSNQEIQKILDLCEKCLLLLKYACKEEFQEIVSKYVEDSDLPEISLFKLVLENN